MSGEIGLSVVLASVLVGELGLFSMLRCTSWSGTSSLLLSWLLVVSQVGSLALIYPPTNQVWTCEEMSETGLAKKVHQSSARVCQIEEAQQSLVRGGGTALE